MIFFVLIWKYLLNLVKSCDMPEATKSISCKKSQECIQFYVMEEHFQIFIILQI